MTQRHHHDGEVVISQVGDVDRYACQWENRQKR
jgi:hypothetical protein